MAAFRCGAGRRPAGGALHVDTGMNRLGLALAEALELRRGASSPSGGHRRW